MNVRYNYGKRCVCACVNTGGILYNRCLIGVSGPCNTDLLLPAPGDVERWSVHVFSTLAILHGEVWFQPTLELVGGFLSPWRTGGCRPALVIQAYDPPPTCFSKSQAAPPFFFPTHRQCDHSPAARTTICL